MSADSIAASAVGVGAASVALVYDQNLAMASAGGLFMYLAVSVTIPIQTRILFSIGSGIFGYIMGLFFMAKGLTIYAAFAAFSFSALGSGIFGSLHKWANGGPTPKWVIFFKDIIPFKIKKGGGSNE